MSPLSVATPPPPAIAAALQSAVESTVFQCSFFVVPGGSQASVSPAPPDPAPGLAETRVRLALAEPTSAR